MKSVWKPIVIFPFLFVALTSCIDYGRRVDFANWNPPRTYAIPGFEGQFEYFIAFSEAYSIDPLPIERSEGRVHSYMTIRFSQKGDSNNIPVSLKHLSSIRFTHLPTNQTFTSNCKVINSAGVLASALCEPDLPLGAYRIEFSARFCAEGICNDFSQVLEKSLILDAHVYPRI